MMRSARFFALIAVLVVLTGCPAPGGPLAFTITVAPVLAGPPASALPGGGVFTYVVFSGYLIRDLGDGGDTRTITLAPDTIYAGLGDFSYSDAYVGDDLHIIINADYVVPNLLDPTHPTVYHVVGQQAWTISDSMNAGVPMVYMIPVHE